MNSARDSFNSQASTSNARSEDLLDDLESWMLHFQSTLDKYRAPLQMQDDIMKLIFSGSETRYGKRAKQSEHFKPLSKIILDEDFPGLDDGIPQRIEKVFQWYKEKGLLTPQQWRICIGSDDKQHNPVLYPPHANETNVEEQCHVCKKDRAGMVKFEYLSFIDQLQMLCQSQTFCYDFLAMWRARSNWCKENISPTMNKTIKEFWDGEKMRMYKDFWDPKKEWEVPLRCPNSKCGVYYRTFPPSLRSVELEAGWKEEDKEYEFLCSTCTGYIRAKPKVIKGDPRNFALMCHWDGFQAASTKPKDSGVVEVVVLNGGKESIIGPLPVIFLPLSLLKLEKRYGDVFPCFLEPLISELELAFMDGFPINYNYPTSAIFGHAQGARENSCNLRAILMSWTGDHPAQCKLGCVKDGGKNGCRRDKPPMKLVTQGMRIPRYVYTDSRYIARYPPDKRHVDDMFNAIRLSRRQQTKEQCNRILSEAGLTGESPLWRLYHLYGFNISLDLVYDTMHILALNLFKKYIRILYERATNDMRKRMDRAIKEVSDAIPHTLRRSGRWPSNATKHHGTFIAEEHQKFIQWCLPHLLNSVSGIEKTLQEAGMILIDIAHIFYRYTRIHGWKIENINTTRKLFTAWRIIMEEEEGESVSPLEHVAGCGEILDDIARHGSHDGVWCYPFERSILGIVEIPTNNRFNELTYTHYHNRALLSRTLRQLRIEKDGMSPTERILSQIHRNLLLPQGLSKHDVNLTTCEHWHTSCLVLSTSEKLAIELYERAHRLGPCPCLQMIDKKGIPLSPLRRKRRVLEHREILGLKDYWAQCNILHSEGLSYSKVYLHGEKYEVNDNVVVNLDINSEYEVNDVVFNLDTNFIRRYPCEVKGICNIKAFLSHEHNREIELFFVGEFMNEGCGIEALQIDKVTGMRIIIDEKYLQRKWCLLPTYKILHKFFFLPLDATKDRVIYEMDDNIFRARLLQPGQPGCVRPWMEKGDVVLVASDNFQCSHSTRIAVVFHVNVQEHNVKLGFLSEDLVNQVWNLENVESTWQDWSTCLEVLQGWHPIDNANYVDGISTCFRKET